MIFAESTVEQAALAWLEGLGYAVLHGPDIAAGEPGAERSDPNYRDVALERRLRQALVHRDYAIAGAKCQLVVTSDTITVKSPGKPVEPLTLEQMQAFSAPMLSRNPVLHYVFARMELAEERGLGLRSMKTRAETAGLPLPRFTWDDPYLVLTIYRSPAAAVHTLSLEVLESLNADERASWEYIVGKDSVTSGALMKQMGFDERKAQRVLKKLQEAGLLRRVGQGSRTRYEVVRS